MADANHLLIGALGPFLLALLLYTLRGGRAPLWLLIAAPLLMALGALWAVAPDLPRLFGYHDLYMRWAFDPRMNIFFWHYSIDQRETDPPWYAAGLVLMAAALLAAAWNELRREEHG